MCNFCDYGENFCSEDEQLSGVSIKIEGKILSIEISDTGREEDTVGVGITLNYCPVCGNEFVECPWNQELRDVVDDPEIKR